MNKNKSVKVIAVTGGKGGVGKTNVSVNLAVSLCKSGKSVLLMDADLGLANVDIMLGVRPKNTLFNVINGECSLKEAIFDGPMGLKVIPASSGVEKMSNLSSKEQLNLIREFDELDIDVDVLIIDTSAGISHSVVNFTKAAQEILVVVCDEPTSLTDSYALIKVLNKEHGINSFRIIANMVNNQAQGRKVFEKLLNVSDQYLDVSLKYMGSVPMDEKLKEAVRAKTALVEKFPNSASGIAFMQIAKKVEGFPAPSDTSGYLEFFIERLIQIEDHVKDLA